MANSIENNTEIERLRRRVEKLSKEKSYLQLLSSLFSEISPVQGLKETVDNALNLIMETIGGTNILIYYCIDKQWYVKDVYSETKKIHTISDKLVSQSIVEERFVEIKGEMVSNGGIVQKKFSCDIEWAYPMIVEKKVIGALKIEGILVNYQDDVKKQLQTFLDFISLKIQYEILNLSKLKVAYDDLKWKNEELQKEITIRKTIEKTLRQSEKKFRKYIECSPTALVIVTDEKKILFVNQALCNMTGFEMDELLFMSIDVVFHDYCREESLQIFQRLFSQGKISEEIKFKRKDGGSIISLMQAIQINDGQFICFCADITEIRTMEEQLRQSEKMQAIGQLAGGVAHDFNNQLCAILGFADIVHSEVSDNPTLCRYMENIIIATERASDLTGNLLTFARKGKYQSVLTNLHMIIIEVVALIERSIDKNVIVVQKLNAKKYTTKGDPTQIQNSLLNLLINARDSMPYGGEILISTELRFLDDDFKDHNGSGVKSGEYVKLSVADTGGGISVETLKHIFEPFFTTKEIGKGTGMGLAAVYGMAKMHKCAITVKSVIGKGATFNLFFPAKERKCSKIEPANSDNNIVRGSGHVLIVDDEELVCEMVKNNLENFGYTVSVCHSGKDAIKFYLKHGDRIDVVILDMVMPGMDGRDTYNSIKSINSEVLTLISSGYSFNDKIEEVFSNGANGFIQKPFNSNELSVKLAEVLKAR